MRSPVVLLTGLLLSIGLAGGVDPAGQAAPDPSTHGAAEEPRVIHLNAAADANRTTIHPGESVAFVATITNTGKTKAIYQPQCHSDTAFWVTNRTGHDVTQGPPCVVEAQGTLQPGDAVRETFTWNGTVWDGERYHPAPAGEYVLHAALHVCGWWGELAEGDGHTAAANATVRVLPPIRS